jgi:hypothetical protein
VRCERALKHGCATFASARITRGALPGGCAK